MEKLNFQHKKHLILRILIIFIVENTCAAFLWNIVIYLFIYLCGHSNIF